MSLGRILIIEDDPEVQTVLLDLLRNAQYSCEAISDGLQGLEYALREEIDAVLLDLSLPSLHGFDVCKGLRSHKPNLPILILTAQGEESDIVSGFELGTDDYILKPFRPKEVLARLRARLKEVAQKKIAQAGAGKVSSKTEPSPSAEIQIGEIRIDTEKMKVYRRGQPLSLSAREYEVILLLASHPGRPFTRDELLSQIWQFDSEDYGINVSVFFSRLRRKFEEDPDNPRYILTLRGIGYRFVEPGELT